MIVMNESSESLPRCVTSAVIEPTVFTTDISQHTVHSALRWRKVKRLAAVLGKPYFKKKSDFMKNFHNMVIPPPVPPVFVKSVFRFFNRKFRDKIKMRQNSVNNHHHRM